jgi:hypothetical protein
MFSNHGWTTQVTELPIYCPISKSALPHLFLIMPQSNWAPPIEGHDAAKKIDQRFREAMEQDRAFFEIGSAAVVASAGLDAERGAPT